MTPTPALAAHNDKPVDGPASAHTPGPWTVIPRGERGTFHIPEAAKHEAANLDDEDGGLVCQANARLIAAAPELLEALKLARRMCGLKGEVHAVIDAAIAKATGAES